MLEHELSDCLVVIYTGVEAKVEVGHVHAEQLRCSCTCDLASLKPQMGDVGFAGQPFDGV